MCLCQHATILTPPNSRRRPNKAPAQPVATPHSMKHVNDGLAHFAARSECHHASKSSKESAPSMPSPPRSSSVKASLNRSSVTSTPRASKRLPNWRTKRVRLGCPQVLSWRDRVIVYCCNFLYRKRSAHLLCMVPLYRPVVDCPSTMRCHRGSSFSWSETIFCLIPYSMSSMRAVFLNPTHRRYIVPSAIIV